MNIRDRHELEKIRCAYDSILKFNRQISLYLDEVVPQDKQEELKAYKANWMRSAVRDLRELLRTYDRYHPDPLEKSLRTGTRRVIWESDPDASDISDGPTYFWIDPDTSLTDEEIDDIRSDETLRCTSPYDCCGQQFTWSFTAHRTPVGIVFINRTGFDY